MSGILPAKVEIHSRDVNGVGGHFLRERVTGAFPVITTDHAFIHEGIAYTLSGTATVDTAWSLGITTPANKYIHFKPVGIAASGGPVIITILEAPTLAGGSAVTPRNRSRIGTSPDSSTVVCVAGTTPSNGTIIATALIPSTTTGSQKTSATSEAAEEWVLKPSTVYAIKLEESTVSTVLIGYELFWYEEDAA